MTIKKILGQSRHDEGVKITSKKRGRHDASASKTFWSSWNERGWLSFCKGVRKSPLVTSKGFYPFKRHRPEKSKTKGMKGLKPKRSFWKKNCVMTPLPRKLFDRHGTKGVDNEVKAWAEAKDGRVSMSEQTVDGFATLTSLNSPYVGCG